MRTLRLRVHEARAPDTFRGTTRVPLAPCLLIFLCALTTNAGPLARLGHTTLAPRHTAPDERHSMPPPLIPFTATPTSSATTSSSSTFSGNLPVPVGTNIFTGRGANEAATIQRRLSLFPCAPTASSTATAPCSRHSLHRRFTTPSRHRPHLRRHRRFRSQPCYPRRLRSLLRQPRHRRKKPPSTFTAVSSVTLNAGGKQFCSGARLTPKTAKRLYFASYILFIAPISRKILKIKLTPRHQRPHPPRRRQSRLNSALPLWTFSIDTPPRLRCTIARTTARPTSLKLFSR